MDSSRHSVPAVDRALSILELLKLFQRGLTVSEMSRRLGLPKSTVSRIINALAGREYLQRDTRRRFRLGLKIVSLSRYAARNSRLAEQARPFLEQLMKRRGLRVNLAILEEWETVVIDKVDPPPRRGIDEHEESWIGLRTFAHCTAIGKAILAYLSDDEFSRRVQSQRMLRFNEHTITSLRQLKKELTEVRRLGFSVNDQELLIGRRAVGAAILDPLGHVVAGISVDGTLEQLPSQAVPAVGALARQTAELISFRLQQTR